MSNLAVVSPSDDAGELQRQKDLAITFTFDKGVTETYSLKATTPLKLESALVKESEKSILNNLSIREVVVGLDHSADLMFLAYNALAKNAIQATVSTLQSELLKATSEATSTMGVFRDKSKNVAKNLLSAYNSILKGREEMAVSQLQRCGEAAEEMATKSDELSIKFQNIANNSQQAAARAIEDKVKDQQAKERLRQKLNSTTALVAQTKTLQLSIEKALEDVQAKYEDARNRENTESERAFISGLIGAIMTPLAAGVGSVVQAVIAIKSPVGLPGGFVNPNKPETGSKPTTEKPAAQGEKEPESLTERLKEKQEEKDNIEEEKRKNDAEIEKVKTIINHPDSSEKDKEEAKQKQQKLESDKITIQQRLDIAQNAITAITSAGEAASQAMLQVSSQAHSAMAIASQQKMDFYKHRNELAKENRNALASLEKYAIEIQSTTEDTNNLEMAIQSLEFAIQALQGVVAALNETSLFWRNMANYCKEKLANKDLEDNIKLMMKYSLETRKEYYSSEEFISQALINLAQWLALQNVCEIYLEEVIKVYNKVNANHGKPLSDKDAAAKVPELAQKVLTSAKDQGAVMEANMQAFQLEMQALTVSAQAVP